MNLPDSLRRAVDFAAGIVVVSSSARAEAGDQDISDHWLG